MMRGGNRFAIAVRTPANDITVKSEHRVPLSDKYRFLKWPLIRGAYVLIDSTIIGIQALTTSANLSGGEQDEQMSKGAIASSLLMSFLFAILVFVLGPVYLAKWTTNSSLAFACVEGVLRLAFFIGYLVLIRRMNDIHRVFQYHGAEHKTINCHEAGLELTVDNVRPQSLLHKRCGTSFLMFVVLISIIVFSFFSGGSLSMIGKIVTRIVLMPVIAGFSYEFIRYSGSHSNRLLSILVAPGFWMQRLTTNEPDDHQIEVAIASVKAVL
ncbi:MAG: hypothetical protein JWN30_149 [Bacilli bacterium]|nr:hypothetical protein [Bacilli bacterium]